MDDKEETDWTFYIIIAFAAFCMFMAMGGIHCEHRITIVSTPTEQK